MTHDAWRGTDRWGRRGHTTLGLQAGEVATYDRKSPWMGMVLSLLSAALVMLAIGIVVVRVMG